jgi:hypothetical protein
LTVAFAGKMPQRTVGLALKGVCELRMGRFVVHEYPERVLNFCLERYPEWFARNSIRAVIEKEPHDRAFPSQQDIIERNHLYPRPMLDAHFNHIQPFSLNGVGERPILLPLALFMPRQQFHEAVESGFHSRKEGCLSQRGVDDDGFPTEIQCSIS